MAEQAVKLRELDFGRRAALRITLTRALAFGAEGMPGASKRAADQQFAALSILATASEKVTAFARPPIVAAIRKALEDFEALKVEGNEAGEQILQLRIETFRKLIQAFDCSHCDGDQDAARKCIAELIEIFDGARAVTEIAYSRTERYVVSRRHELFLETSDTNRYQATEVFDIAAVTGTCRLADTAHTLRSIVGLVIKDGAFGWTTLGQLPYVLMHELLCHAFQGLKGPDRVVVDYSCPWTEGWMDAVAFALTEEWLSGSLGVGLPQWLQDQTHFVHEAASELHRRRRKPGGTSSPRILAARQFAYDTLFTLERLYQGADPDRAHARSLVHRFSLSLNLHALTQEERADIAEWIGLGLEFPSRSDEVLGACSAFLLHDSWQRLYNELKSLMN